MAPSRSIGGGLANARPVPSLGADVRSALRCIRQAGSVHHTTEDRTVEASFWLERWERQQIGFHQRNINPRLLRFWPDLGLARGGAVFVPLCGKSTDMLWLHAQGHPVLGVELSPVAVAAFFTENDLAPQ